MPITFYDLPDELVLQTYHNLDTVSLVQAAQVSRRWYDLARDNALWRHKLQQDFALQLSLLPGQQRKNGYAVYRHLCQTLRKVLPIWQQQDKPIYFYLQSLLQSPEDCPALYTTSLPHNAVLAPHQLVLYLYQGFILNNEAFSLSLLRRYRAQLSADSEILTELLNLPALLGNQAFIARLISEFSIALDQLVVVHAIYSYNPALISMLINQFDLPFTQIVLDHAAKAGNQRLVQTFIQQYHLVPDKNTLDMAVVSGNLPLAQWLIQKYHLQPDLETMSYATASNNQILFDWLTTSYALQADEETLDFAASHGNQPLVMRLARQFSPTQDTLHAAAESGNEKLVQELLNQYHLVPDVETLNHAAESGNAFLVQHLITQYHLQPDHNTLIAAVISSNYLLIEYLNSKHQLVPDAKVLLYAIDASDLPLLIWLSDKFHLPVTEKLISKMPLEDSISCTVRSWLDRRTKKSENVIHFKR